MTTESRFFRQAIDQPIPPVALEQLAIPLTQRLQDTDTDGGRRAQARTQINELLNILPKLQIRRLELNASSWIPPIDDVVECLSIETLSLSGFCEFQREGGASANLYEDV